MNQDKSGEYLMGYKGTSYMDSGFIYAPFIPLTQTPVVLDSEEIPVEEPKGKKKKYRSIDDPWEEI